jgi:hypothetical protein
MGNFVSRSVLPTSAASAARCSPVRSGVGIDANRALVGAGATLGRTERTPCRSARVLNPTTDDAVNLDPAAPVWRSRVVMPGELTAGPNKPSPDHGPKST